MRTLKRVSIYAVFASSLLFLGQCGCLRQSWSTTFNREGQSSCNYHQSLIRGFYRSSRQVNDYLSQLKEANCCDFTPPWTLSSNQIVHTDWTVLLKDNNKWVHCPAGYYLTGMYRSENTNGWLHNIEDGICAKPGDHPNSYGLCYDQDIDVCFNTENLCECNEGYFVTGLYKGSCDSLYCLDKFRCCKMASGPEPLDELFKVKTRIMDTTMSKIALLAHYLGYAYSCGCGAEYVGENFRRDEDSWIADNSRCFAGEANYQRLVLAYGDWNFAMKEVKYGDPVVDELLPETVDSGTFYNFDQHEATKTMTTSNTVVQSIAHSVTSGWKEAHELGIEFNFFIGGASYKFSYENSMTTENSNSREQSKTFEISTSKTLPANSSASWRLVISKTRTTIPYTAAVTAKFSTELQGFLRKGAGYKGENTNYHYKYRNSDVLPTINYRFGNSKNSFSTALKRASDTNSFPWQWNDMKNKYSYAQDLINGLCDENVYTFTLTGQFVGIKGTRADLHWEPTKSVTKRSADHVNREVEDNGEVQNLKHVAVAGPDDVPAPKPPPPELKIEVGRRPVSFPVVT